MIRKNIIRKTTTGKSSRRCDRGFTLVEILIATALGTAIVGSALTLFTGAVSASFTVMQRAEMQQNARGSVNALVHDLSVAGTGIPYGGVPLPGGAGSTVARFACNQIGVCYVANNSFLNNRLSAVVPNPGGGPTMIGKLTSTITVAYADLGLAINQYPLANISAAGDQITVDSRSAPLLTNAAKGVQVGDLILVTNTKGSAVAEVSSVGPGAGILNFASSDPLNFNQPAAASGKISSLALSPGVYPPTTATRIFLVTYFIQQLPGPDGVMNTPDDVIRLMRQVNGLTAIPIADNIENLQFSYEIFDDTSGVETANTQNANLQYNQIRKVNIAVTARSASKFSPKSTEYQRLTLATSVSPRNLTYHDRYQ